MVADHVVEVSRHLKALLAGPAAGVKRSGGPGLHGALPAQSDDLGHDDQYGQPPSQGQSEFSDTPGFPNTSGASQFEQT